MATTTSSVTSTTASTATASAKAAASTATTAKKSAAQSLISKLGSGSGVDLNALATSLVDAERVSQTESINKNISKSEARISGYSALMMTIDTVKSAFDALQKPSSVNLVSATSSNTSAVTVSATTGAMPGSHELNVTARAQGQRNLSAGFAATDTKLSNNDFYLQLTVNGKPKMIKVAAASATPAGMVSAINNAKLGINAQLINTGDGSANPYKIVLNGATGASNSFTLRTDDGSGDSEQQKLVFSPAMVAGSFKIGDVSVTVKAGDTGAAISSAAKSALEAADSKNGTTGRTYTVNPDGSLTIDYAKTDGDMDPVTVTDPLLTGVSASVSTVRPFSAGKPLSAIDQAKQQTLTFGTATATGTISVGGVSVDVAANDAPNVVAYKVAQAFADPANAAALGGKTIVDNQDGTLTIGYPFADGDATLGFTDSGSGVTMQAATAQAYAPKTSLVNIDFSSRLQTAGDASFTLNGVAMSRSSNTITDAIPGVTLNLVGTTTLTGPVSLSVDRDTNALKDKVKALVDAVNTTMSDLKTLSGPKNTSDPNDVYSGSLQNDSTVQLVRTQIRNLMLNNSASPGANVKALRDIGVSVDKTGTLTFDEAKFDSAVSTSFDDVVTMLTANKESKSQYTTLPQGLAGDAVKRLADLTKTTGYIKGQSDSAQKSVDRYKAQLEAVEARLTRLQESYTKTFANLDTLVGSINSQKSSLKSTFDAMLNAKNN